VRGPKLASHARADLRFTAASVDLGDARSGVPLSHAFAFVNDGPDALEIVELRPGCGCVIPRLEKRRYKARARGAVLLEINTLAQTAGPHTWTLQVRYRSGTDLHEASLRMKAVVIHEISVQPAALIVFADRASTHDLTFTDTRTQPLTITAVCSTSPFVTGKVTPREGDAGPRVATIRVAIAEDLPDGRHEEALHIYTDDKTYRDLSVTVTIIKKPHQRIQAFPGELTWTRTGSIPLPSQIVRLRDSRGETVVVDRIVPDDPAISCRWAPGPNTMATLKISVEESGVRKGSLADSNGAELQSAIHVHIGKPVTEVLTIPVLVRK
jgi:hypothetical protein